MAPNSVSNVANPPSAKHAPSSVSVGVWDLPTRLFHWLLFLAVVVSYVTGEERGWLFAVHTVSGYVVALLLLFRLVWGFIGSRRSRFGDFVRGPWAVTDYAKHLAHLHPPRFIGHNPLGGWMALALMTVLALSVITGLFSAQEEGAARGILFPLIAGYGDEGLGEIHEFLGNLVVVLASVHVAAVFADWLLTRENLVGAMLTGRKRVDPAVAAKEPPFVAGWRALIIVLLVAIAGAALFRGTDFAAIAVPPAQEKGDTTEED
jgi:cytochrome b